MASHRAPRLPRRRFRSRRGDALVGHWTARYFVCPICFNAKRLDQETLIAGAELQGTVPMWAWIGDEGATTFSY